MTVTRQEFGHFQGLPVWQYECTNPQGLVLRLTNYGATVLSVETPDRDGNRQNITLGFDSLAGYQVRHPFFGATVGRFCNRIGGGRFDLNGASYQLACNDGANHLHGGSAGFDRFVWDAEVIDTREAVGVHFTRVSPDGEEGYPGNLAASVRYSLTPEDELAIEFHATTDKPTPLNLTNHNYWNLAGAGKVLEHELMLTADRYLPVNDQLIPTGEFAPVAGTPFDFTSPMPLGRRLSEIDSDPPGYDHCYVLGRESGVLKLAARVKDPASGRVMEVRTTQPGIQLYTGNFLDGSATNGGFGQHEAFCLETQHFPDSPNQASFPSTILEPGQDFRQETRHQFLVD